MFWLHFILSKPSVTLLALALAIVAWPWPWPRVCMSLALAQQPWLGHSSMALALASRMYVVGLGSAALAWP